MSTLTTPHHSLFALDSVRCLRLAEQLRTPLFVYRRDLVESAYQDLRAALPQRVRIAYAVKANPHPRMLQILAEQGASFDCASGGELRRVPALGLGPGRIFFAGPGKRQEELALALAMGVRLQAEGWEDLQRLEELASSPVEVNLRVHPLHGPSEANRIIGGTGPSAFGVDEEEVPELLERASCLKKIRIRGLHVFAASNQRDAKVLLDTHAAVLSLAKRLHEQQGLVLDQIDLGGGLGIPYAYTDPVLDIEKLGRGLGALLDEHAWFKGELILEPGRYLAGPCGVFLNRVVRVKESRGTRFVILEGGINHLLRPLLTGEPFPVRVVGRRGPTSMATLTGPLCTSLDRLGEVRLPEVRPGDLLAFGMVGAYGFTEAMAPFLSHPIPEEVWV